MEILDKYGYWSVINKTIINHKVLCECSCGKRKYVNIYTLNNGSSTNCGHLKNIDRLQDLTGMQFGKLKVIRHIKGSKWLCKCSCGNDKIADRNKLLNGVTTNCGCTPRSDIKDLAGKEFGKLKVKKYVGNKKWLCECECGNTKIVRAANLLNGSTKSCGCLITDGSSFCEKEVADLFPNCVRNDRTIIPPQELDIYLPDKKIAIEVNGDYWHSSYMKDSTYHQRKTIACNDNGIRLIHIFEYEWKDEDKREKLISFLKDATGISEKKVIYARKTEVCNISKCEANTFLDMYHLQYGNNQSRVQLGLKYNGELLSVITFSTPRFDRRYQYEILRYCVKPGITVVGGLNKLFKHFIEMYHPKSIVTYSDLTKFTGNIYSRLGFKLAKNSITKPNYVWVSSNDGDILTRYQTRKKNLVHLGLGDESQTEDEIMKGLGYYKIYDSGCIKQEWLAVENKK